MLVARRSNLSDSDTESDSAWEEETNLNTKRKRDNRSSASDDGSDSGHPKISKHDLNPEVNTGGNTEQSQVNMEVSSSPKDDDAPPTAVASGTTPPPEGGGCQLSTHC